MNGYLLGITFPKSYREFIGTYGSALIFSYSIAGICERSDPEECPLFDHVVDQTMFYRSCGIPPTVAVISGDEGDNVYLLDCTPGISDQDAAILNWGDEGTMFPVAKNFRDFLERKARRQAPWMGK